MIFIKNGKINIIINGIIYGDIFIDEGKIIEIGEDLIVFLDVEVIDVSNKFVFFGFIDVYIYLGLWEDGIGFEGVDGNEEIDLIIL